MQKHTGVQALRMVRLAQGRSMKRSRLELSTNQVRGSVVMSSIPVQKKVQALLTILFSKSYAFKVTIRVLYCSRKLGNDA
jgi:hypothetical protein